MKAHTLQRRALRVTHVLGLFAVMLTTSNDLCAGCCCYISVPEIRFHSNSTVPIDGDLDLRCVSRRMNADSALSEIAMLLRENPTITMLIVGHTDSEEAHAETLSLQRAQHMACELVSTYGIVPGRLTTEGKGSGQPRIDERMLHRMSKSERGQGRQINRRVEFRVMSFDWTAPHPDDIAAVRFLSDPETPLASATSFCDEPVEAPDTSALVQTPDTTIIALEEPAALSLESRSVQLETLAPMIVPNPIVNDELSLVWSPQKARAISFRMMTLDGRMIMEQHTTGLEQGVRFTLPVPRSLASGTYILRINTGTHDWSLRFVKP